MSQLLETNSDDVVDAVAAMSDELASGALRAADQAGITVSDEMAVTRWDDADAAAPAGLTTVHQDLRDQGAGCARVALDHPSSPDPPGRETIIRRSFGPQDRIDGD